MKRILLFCLTAFLITGFAACSDDYDDSELRREIETLKTQVARINSDIAALQLLVTASTDGMQILNVVETSTGYKLIFNDGSSLSLNHGENGTSNSDIPVIGVRADKGTYYWTVTRGTETDWLRDDAGNKIMASGSAGSTPVIAVDSENFWTVNGDRISNGNGGYVKATGDRGSNGDAFFTDVTETSTEVVITLADGTMFSLPKVIPVMFTLARRTLTLRYGTTGEVAITQSGVNHTTVSKPDGWKVSVETTKVVVTAPAWSNVYSESRGLVSIVAIGESTTIVETLTVMLEEDVTGGNLGSSHWENW